MTTKLLAASGLATLTLLTVTFAADPKPAPVDTAPLYPEGFLQWQQVKTTTLDPKNPATAKATDAHFVYANPKAVEGLRTGHYPEGAVFVLDIFAVTKKDGTVTLGARASSSSMERVASATETGGWAFGDYDIATKAPLKTSVISDCYECHTKKADHGYVFTTLKS